MKYSPPASQNTITSTASTLSKSTFHLKSTFLLHGPLNLNSSTTTTLTVCAPTSKMGLRFTFADLYRAPEINPVNRKARAVPMLNPVNQYGRVFFFSWFGFMVAFWAWYSKSILHVPAQPVPIRVAEACREADHCIFQLSTLHSYFFFFIYWNEWMLSWEGQY